jgi:uncharacterized protein involved in exopolysaccharide biosynthesis
MPTVDTGMTLRDYASIVDRRRWIVNAAAFFTTLVALVSTVLQTPIYSADAEVLIQPRGQDGLFEDQVVNVNERAIQTEIQVIEGQAVRVRAQEDLALDELTSPAGEPRNAAESSSSAPGQVSFADFLTVSEAT